MVRKFSFLNCHLIWFVACLTKMRKFNSMPFKCHKSHNCYWNSLYHKSFVNFQFSIIEFDVETKQDPLCFDLYFLFSIQIRHLFSLIYCFSYCFVLFCSTHWFINIDFHNPTASISIHIICCVFTKFHSNVCYDNYL